MDLRRSQAVAEAIVLCLSDDLRRPPWRDHANPLAGHCYVASESYFHLVGREQGFRPAFVRHEGQPHWFLMQGNHNAVIDLTGEQFLTCPPYRDGVYKGFLTLQPSKRAMTLMDRVAARLTATTLTAR